MTSCSVGVAFCLSGLDAMYVSLVLEGEEEEERTGTLIVVTVVIHV